MRVMASVFDTLSKIIHRRSHSSEEKQEAKHLLEMFIAGKVHTSEELLARSSGMLQAVAREAEIHLSAARDHVEKSYPHLFKDQSLGNTLDEYLATCKTAKHIMTVGSVFSDAEMSIRDFCNGIRHVQRIIYHEKLQLAGSGGGSTPDLVSTSDTDNDGIQPMELKKSS